MATPDLKHSESLRRSIRTNLSALTRLEIGDSDLPRAGVALTLVPDDDGRTRWLLTRRQPRMRTHSGQLALPGGRCNDGETAVEGAMRELREELGISADRDLVLGRLDDYATRSGYVMQPVVIWADTTVDIRPDPVEVAEVFTPRLDEMLRDDAPRIESIPESDRPIVKMPVRGDLWVNAPTAAVLYQFREVALLGRHTRVSHFEQPTWAWK